MEKLSKKIIARETFYFLFWLSLTLVFLEIMAPNIVLAYFNLNYLFLALVVSGIYSLIKK
ncbi:MAG: hypothetical protein HY931_02785 [Candidatus Falkowbacteria bacterium]|nr:MAG: hypothetical protein HY931_02785 [Candidatus Falkowbacteria bacterium]